MSILVLRAVSISNDLFDSDVMYYFCKAKGYNKSLLHSTTPEMLSQNLIISRGTLISKEKLNLIVSTETTVYHDIHPYGLVQVCVRTVHKKRGRFISPCPVQLVDASAGAMSVPGSHGHNVTAAPEDIIITITEDYLATQIIESIDNSYDGVFEVLHNTTSANYSSVISNQENI